MDQNTIVKGLREALTNASGSLDDLNALLKKAQEDVAQAKKDEAAAKEKAKADRGNKVAQLATRLLNSELTDDDMAFVMNTFYAQKGLQPVWDAAGIGVLTASSTKAADDLDQKTEKVVDELADFFEKWLGVEIDRDKVKTETKVNKNGSSVKAEYRAVADGTKVDKNKKDPDDVIRKFLQDFGL